MMNFALVRCAPDRSPLTVATIGALLLAIAPAVAQEGVTRTTTSPATIETTATYVAPTDTGAPSAAVAIGSTPDSDLHNVNVTQGNQVSSEPRRFQYGLQITVRGVYDDNINISHIMRISDYYIAIEPVLTLGFGDVTGGENNYLRFDYAPGLFLFVRHSENDAFQELFHLGAHHRFSRLTLNFDEEIAILNGTDLRSFANQTSPGSNANIDVGSRARFETYNTKMDASYDLSGKTFVSAGVDSTITEYDSASLFSSEAFGGSLSISYRYGEKIVLGVGGTGGYDVVGGPNPNETFEQANARLSYQATGKISLNLSAGVEFRQFENNSRGQYVSPVYELSANYQPTDSTSVILSGSRRTYNSGVLAGEDFAGTTITASLRQRFLQRFFFGVAGGYQNNSYFSTISGLTTNRNDDYYFIEPSLNFGITRFWFIGGYYLRRQNDSTLQTFRFDDTQAGFQSALVF